VKTASDIPEGFPFPLRTEVEVLGPDDPRPGRPVWELSDTGLVSIRFDPCDAAAITNLLMERVRRITWIEDAGADEFREIHRMSRMMFEMSEAPSPGFPSLSNMSREDVEILYALNSHRVGWLTNVINSFRERVREHGPVGPVEADLVAKDFLTVMTG
jgi:hypothetical protein